MESVVGVASEQAIGTLLWGEAPSPMLVSAHPLEMDGWMDGWMVVCGRTMVASHSTRSAFQTCAVHPQGKDNARNRTDNVSVMLPSCRSWCGGKPSLQRRAKR
jgi:hypothetical protein